MSDGLLNVFEDLRTYKQLSMASKAEMIYLCGNLGNAVEYNLAFIKLTTCNDIPIYLNFNKEELQEMIRSLQLALRKMELMSREHPSASQDFTDVLKKFEKVVKDS